MKFGIHLSTYTKTWDEDVFQYIEPSKVYGYDGVEFPLMNPEQFDIKKAKRRLKDYEMKCTCGTGLNNQRDISSLDTSIQENGLHHLRKCIDICNELETDCLGGVLYAPWGQYMTREEGKECIQTSLENLAKIGNYAKEKGVVLALEILNRYETYFLNTVEEGKNYIREINHPHIKLHFDTFHANIEEKSLKQALVNGNKDIYHIHFCENNRGVPGTGHINWQEVKEGIQDIGYNRWIILENFVMPNCEVGKDVFIWRSIDKSGNEVARKGIKFMKSLLSTKE
ncbi:sugar phosphate isomerase/epimerase family protein [Vallitalea okinawensis]|uniref:sugar phosphate isomerase/epimerase family protein n=1 Tax=Vallitalea okinawensis TaxID=2078660 RepID=UPI000CFD8747|nr:sugar phosphate isomerase/epimerase family protein [Vallitalea okinawensis]